MRGCTTSDVGAVAPLGIVMVGLPLSASATVGRPAAGVTGSPVARDSGVRFDFTSMTNNSVSFFLTFDDLSFLVRPSFGEIASNTRLPTVSPVRLVTNCWLVFVLSSTSEAGDTPYDVWICLPVRPSTST